MWADSKAEVFSDQIKDCWLCIICIYAAEK